MASSLAKSGLPQGTVPGVADDPKLFILRLAFAPNRFFWKRTPLGGTRFGRVEAFETTNIITSAIMRGKAGLLM
jgi:hypothetical protein